MPRKGEGGRGIVEGCVDYNCEKGCQKGGEGEHDEGERFSEEVGYKVQAGEEEEGGKGNAIEYAECNEETKEGGSPKR